LFLSSAPLRDGKIFLFGEKEGSGNASEFSNVFFCFSLGFQNPKDIGKGK
jgi:hypothetical protein